MEISKNALGKVGISLENARSIAYYSSVYADHPLWRKRPLVPSIVLIVFGFQSFSIFCVKRRNEMCWGKEEKHKRTLALAGSWTQTQFSRHILPLIAFTQHANTIGLRQQMWCKMEAG